ncbi:MAG: hypothetical protein Q8P54_00045 [bacterium]|nr:hypothetical protein [bacterium]
MQLSCHGCSLPVLATVFLSSKKGLPGKKNGKLTSESKRTDLKPKEKYRFTDKDSISSSEIADLYLFLDNYKGGFEDLSNK